MIAIIDYGLGNLRSVAGAVEKVGHRPIISNKLEDLEAADKLILPGVGAFGDGMKNLHQLGLVEPLTELVIKQGKPILGICLGAQLMAKESFEFGHYQGLGWLDASVVRIEANSDSLRIPHVGWNNLIPVRSSTLLAGIPSDALFYYVHSFHIKCHNPEIAVGECEYGMRFVSVLEKGNIFATQFHPEKSQRQGLNLLTNFLERC